MTRSTLAVLSEWAGHSAHITTGVAGLSYAFGWVLMVRFYGALGVNPEDVGITFSWLVVRAFLVGLLALGVMLTARWLQDRATSLRSANLVLSIHTEVRSLVEVRLRGRYWLRGGAGILIGFTVVFMLLLPFRLGDRFAADVRAGQPVDFGILGMSVVRVDPVRLTPADPSKPAPVTGCVLRLGSNAGTSLFVNNGAVVRVSDQNVTVSSPC